MRRTARVGNALIAVLLALLAAPAVPPEAQAASCLAPGGGGDDTTALQAALDRCSGARGPCEVRLCAGVFDTGILRVRDFRGTIRGAGPRATVLRARPDLPVSDLPEFFREDPFSPDRAPWPYLLQLVEGKAEVRDIGLLVPAPPAGSRPTTGWSLFEGFDPSFELRGALLLTGERPVDFEVTRVRVVAEADEASDLGTTAFHGVEFGGLLFDPGDAGPFPVSPASGRFRLTDSELLGVLSGAPIGEIARSRVEVARNRVRATVAVEVIDADRSHVAIRSNRWHVSYRGVQVRQNLDGRPSGGSGLVVDGNEGSLAPFLPGLGDGIAFEDPFDASPEPGGSVLWASRNRLALGDGEGAAATGITARGAARPRIAGNRVSGRAGTGVSVDSTSGCVVLGNAFAGLDTGAGPDLRLGPDTSDCLAIVASDDTVVDEGSANRVVRRPARRVGRR